MYYSKKLELRTNGFKASDNLIRHIYKNMERLYRHEDNIERIHLFLSKSVFGNTQESYSVISRLAVPGPDIVVEETGDNIERLITKSSHVLDRQIRRKSRKQASAIKSISLKKIPLAS